MSVSADVENHLYPQKTFKCLSLSGAGSIVDIYTGHVQDLWSESSNVKKKTRLVIFCVVLMAKDLMKKKKKAIITH